MDGLALKTLSDRFSTAAPMSWIIVAPKKGSRGGKQLIEQ
jgi:hypothetical protein